MRAKSHDQRKGQWLINKIRMHEGFNAPPNDELDHAYIERFLWNMENDGFDKFMGDYNK